MVIITKREMKMNIKRRGRESWETGQPLRTNKGTETAVR